MVSVLLHAALLTLQFGVSGKGQPSSGWLWGARSASAPSASLHVELRAAPVETKAAPTSVLPATVSPAPMTASPSPSFSSPPVEVSALKGFVVQTLKRSLPPEQIKPRPAPPSRKARPASRRHDGAGRPVLSVRKKATPEAWRIAASELTQGHEADDHRAQVKQDAILSSASESSAPPVSEIAELPELPKESPHPQPQSQPLLAKTDSAEDARKTLLVAQEAALKMQRQQAEEAEAERVAAQALQKAREEEALARAQAEAVRRKAERDALARLAAEEEVLRREQEAKAWARAQLLQQQAAEEEKRQQALLEEAARREAQARALQQAQEKQRAEAQRLAEQQQQAEMARAQAEQEAAARAQEQAQAQVRAEAAAREARLREREAALAEEKRLASLNARPGESSLFVRAEASRGSGTVGSAASSGRSLAEQALAMAKSGLPQKPPAEADSLAQGARRVLPGRNPAEVQRAFYSDGWVQKVERLSKVNYPSLSRHRAYGSLVVSVTLRSDGSLVEVHVLKSSGSREVDEAARRLIELSAPFSAFPPDLRRVYETIEIKRTLSFPDRPPLIITE